MKTLALALGLALVGLVSTRPAPAAGVAPVVMGNEKLLVHSGHCSCGLGLVWTIYFSTYYTEDVRWVNEEIAPLPQPDTHAYWTYLVLEDPSMWASASFVKLNLPTDDANANGIADFFEVSEAVAASSGGTYQIEWGTGQLTFDWSRAAGSRVGSMVLTMHDPILGTMGPFTHTFELSRYTGQIAYTPGSNTVSGTITLVKDGTPATWWSGPVTITKSPTNRFNQLTLAAGTWTNQSSAFGFGDTELTRDPAYPTLYQGSIQAPGGGSQFLKLLITDSNDVNSNGIPDFSDDLAVVNPPRRPTLALSLTKSNLLLRVSGDTGRTNVIQQATTPSASTWTNALSLMITNDPQIIALPWPAANSRFWRVRVE